MTEAEWLAGVDPEAMLGWLTRDTGPFGPYGDPECQKQKWLERKLRLFACACCHRLRLEDQRLLSAVQIVERYAEGELGGTALQNIEWDVNDAVNTVFGTKNIYAALAVQQAIREFPVWNSFIAHCLHAGLKFDVQANLLRCIFGNPFRPVGVLQLPHESIGHPWLRRKDGTVSKLARRIYDDCNFDSLPVLADALEEAGCEQEDLLRHLRGPGPHARGCWALDLILGKN